MTRLDKYLTDNGYYESRNRAAEAIKSAKVMVDGKIAKASQKVNSNSDIEIEDEKFYVSRAAKKLEGFLAKHPITLQNAIVLDIGSSTGGFAQILLEGGISHLDCVDVGKEQMHHSLKSHKAMHLHEETDIRVFKTSQKYSIITCDVSFISILQIINDIDRLASSNTDIIILYKPQFEVGRTAKRDSRGMVTDKDAIATCIEEFTHFVTQKLHWNLKTHAPSSLSGKDGNLEYLYHFTVA